MNETFSKIVNWIKSNMLLSIIVGLVVIIVLFGRKLKSLFFRSQHKRRRKNLKVKRGSGTRMRKPIPRSVGIRASGKGYPAAGGGYIPFKRNKDGTIKKAWQVAGTLAAKSRMNRLRKARA